MASNSTGIRGRFNGDCALRRRVTLAGLCALVCGALALPLDVSVHAASRRPQSYERLKLGQPVRREVAAGEFQEYAIDLAQGQQVQIVVYYEGVPVSVSLRDWRAGETLAGDRAESLLERSVIVASIERTDTYGVLVEAQGKRGRAGRYELLASVVDHSDEEFCTRERVQKLKWEMWRAYYSGKKEVGRAVVENG